MLRRLCYKKKTGNAMSGIIVADAGPLPYIIIIDCAEILQRLFERILIPPVVCDELLHDFFPRRRRHTILQGDWSSDVCSSDLALGHRGSPTGDASPSTRLLKSIARRITHRTATLRRRPNRRSLPWRPPAGT